MPRFIDNINVDITESERISLRNYLHSRTESDLISDEVITLIDGSIVSKLAMLVVNTTNLRNADLLLSTTNILKYNHSICGFVWTSKCFQTSGRNINFNDMDIIINLQAPASIKVSLFNSFIAEYRLLSKDLFIKLVECLLYEDLLSLPEYREHLNVMELIRLLSYFLNSNGERALVQSYMLQLQTQITAGIDNRLFGISIEPDRLVTADIKICMAMQKLTTHIDCEVCSGCNMNHVKTILECQKTNLKRLNKYKIEDKIINQLDNYHENNCSRDYNHEIDKIIKIINKNK